MVEAAREKRERRWAEIARVERQQGIAVARRARVVLAEDDPELRSLVASVLRADGHEVIELVDGSDLAGFLEALRFGSVEAPALILSDIRMPGASGLEVLAHLRRGDWSTPVVLMTAFGDLDTHQEAKRLGAAAVFDKPFDLDDLRTAVVNLLV